ncbi:MAG: BBP7 family outer membrane beta-barrel protein [Pirellulaceae bacterium]
MRSLHARCVATALGLLSLAGGATAQDVGAPALFPIPSPAAFPVAQTAANDWYAGAASDAGQPLPSPSDAPIQKSVINPDYRGAMQGNWDGPATAAGGCATGLCDAGCGRGKYIYANGLVMTHEKNGGFVTSVDGTSGDPELLFCSPEYGGIWHGGFELGTGWSFGCAGERGLEVVYWGLYAAPGTVTATGDLDSLIDFGDLDYNGGTGNDIYDGAAAHRLDFDQGFHSLEVNLLGNYGGPLGGGRCGGCAMPDSSRMGFGWLAGFRYINFTEDWLFSSDFSGTSFDNDADQLNYEVDLQNNLFGFQMGAGLNYCVTDRFQAYSVAKFGVFGNDIQMQQRVYGSAGSGVLSTGDFAGDDYLIDASDLDLSFAGQMDIGGRYNINHHWSADFGYRLLGLSGVAISEDNVAQGDFQNVLGISDIQTTGSLILHGGYAGLTYCW